MKNSITAKKVIVRLIIGFVAGMAVGLLIPLIAGSESIASPRLVRWFGDTWVADVLQIILSGVMGIAGFGGTLLYEMDSLNVAKATLIHLAAVLVCFLSLGFVLEWFPPDIKWILPMCAIMVAAFFTIWMIMYLIGRRQIKKLNKIKKNYNKHTEE